MSNTPEGKVKVKIRRWVDLNMPGSWRVAPKGGMFGKVGCPDDIICWMGVFIGMEIKSDTGKPTEAQLEQLKLISKAGGVACIVTGFDVDRLEAVKAAALEIANGRGSK